MAFRFFFFVIQNRPIHARTQSDACFVREVFNVDNSNSNINNNYDGDGDDGDRSGIDNDANSDGGQRDGGRSKTPTKLTAKKVIEERKTHRTRKERKKNQ